jgi:hypothetical protein
MKAWLFRYAALSLKRLISGKGPKFSEALGMSGLKEGLARAIRFFAGLKESRRASIASDAPAKPSRGVPRRIPKGGRKPARQAPRHASSADGVRSDSHV